MPLLVEYGYGLAAMAVLICCSAFFSGSEAALFYLQHPDRRALRSGNAAQRLAISLLDSPDELLMAVLFWNLLINMTYFAVASIVGIQLERGGRHTEAGAFTAAAVLAIIVLSEMLPKSLAVLQPRFVAAVVSLPLAAAVRALRPVMPAIRVANLAVRRLIWPKFSPEPHLELSDLERAIALSTSDTKLMEQEQRALQNIVALSDMRVEELMRPRTQVRAFRPPVSIEDFEGRMTPSGNLLVTEPASDEIVSALPLRDLADLPRSHLEHFAEGVLYLPWCATADTALDEMHRREREVVVVVNEHGATVGVVTYDDILDTIFGDRPSRSERLLQRSSITEVQPGVWHVTGITNLRRLAKRFGVATPPSKSVTVAGILQEVLQRLPAEGDTCHWGSFRLRVLESPAHGHLLVELTRPGSQTP
ncbi:MAG: CNNM domain-containing protein [Planctomycetia bacterium]|nr:MAG: CNNM domain-containing protein [Planctomycetia bacterium]